MESETSFKIRTRSPHLRHTPKRLDAGKRNSKVDETYDHLLTLAHELGPRAKMPTVRELREVINVSQATLDAAMVRLENQNVLVRRQGSGVYVSSRLKQRNIALLCDAEYFITYGASPFWGLLVNQIRSLAYLSEAVLNLQFLKPFVLETLDNNSDAEPIPAPLQEAILAGTVHGVLTIGVPHPVARWIEAQGVPVVAYAGAANYILTHDNAAIAEQGIAELARQGCRTVLPWIPSPSPRSARVHRSCAAAAAAFGVALIPLPYATSASDEAPNANRSFAQALDYFGSPPGGTLPGGVLFTDDMTTQAVLMAFYRLGIVPGRDIRIVSHSNAESPTLMAWHDQITRLEFDLADLVILLFETLDARMNGEEPDWVVRGEGVLTPEWQYLFKPTLRVPGTLL